MNHLAVQIENAPSNYVTHGIKESMHFWNNQADSLIRKNKSGEYGNAETQKMAQTMQADDFMLEMLLIDCKTFCNSQFAKDSGNTYECGRTRSHIWVHLNGKRVLMLYSKKFMN